MDMPPRETRPQFPASLQDGNDADDDQPHYDWDSEADSNGEAAQEEQKRKVSWEEGYE